MNRDKSKKTEMTYHGLDAVFIPENFNQGLNERLMRNMLKTLGDISHRRAHRCNPFRDHRFLALLLRDGILVEDGL
jgi:hypothetical protein